MTTSIDYMNPVTALGAGAFVLGALYRGNTRDEESKSVASIIMVLGLAIIAGGVCQSYSDYQAESEELRYQKIFQSIPTDGKLGELFAIFRDKIGVTRENFIDSGSSFVEEPAGWGYDPEKGHQIFLNAKCFSSENHPRHVGIELIQNSQEVIAHLSGLERVVEKAKKIIPQVINSFSRFLDGEKIYESGYYAIGSLQFTGRA